MQVEENDDDDDDPVVRELDVFLSHGLASSTYLLQFPLQNKHTADAAELLRSTTECRMKPHRNLLELDLALDTECSNYDPDSRLCAPTRTIKSHAVPAKANYTVGALRGNELHLTPLHAAVQMRPSFQLVDELDEKDKEANGQPKEDPRASAAAKKAEAASSGAPDVYKVTIKRAETERTIERRQRSHAYLAREEQKEPWVDVELNNLGTESSAREKEKLFVADTSATALPSPLPKQDYLDLLSPPLSGADDQAVAAAAAQADSIVQQHQNADSYSTPAAGLQELSMHSLRSMDLEQQASALLRHSGVLRFDRLVTVMQTTADQEEALIRALEREATLVQGCWVVKSSLVCNNVQEQLKLLPYREKLCLSLVQDQFVNQTRFCEATGLNHLAVAKLFTSLTTKEFGRGCRLKVEADSDFCAKYPELVERQRKAWLERADEINANFAGSVDVSDVGMDTDGSEERLADSDADSDAASGRHERTVRSLLERHGVATRRLIAKQLKLDGALPKTIDVLINTLCVKLSDGEDEGGSSWCIRLQGSESVDKYRSVVVGLFQDSEKIRKADMNAAARAELGEEIPSPMYTKICKELATSHGQVWTRKTPVDVEEELLDETDAL
jgi:DNA-directed RNA polymerase-3 subunit RPC5